MQTTSTDNCSARMILLRDFKSANCLFSRQSECDKMSCGVAYLVPQNKEQGHWLNSDLIHRSITLKRLVYLTALQKSD